MSAETINKVIFGGRVVADAEVRYNADGRPTVRVRFVLANRRRNEDGEWVDDPMWMRVVCFGRLAERYLERPLLKGNRITVVGRIETPRIWKSDRGEGIDLTILADEIARYDFGDREDFTDDAGPEVEAVQQQPQQRAPQQQRQAAPAQRAAAPNGRAAPQQRRGDVDAADLEDLPF
jgi:single-strand DNA-binding protein